MIQNKEVLEQIREEAVKELNSYDCRILVCSGTGCVATGSQKIYEKFMEIAKDAPGVTIEFGPHDQGFAADVPQRPPLLVQFHASLFLCKAFSCPP